MAARAESKTEANAHRTRKSLRPRPTILLRRNENGDWRIVSHPKRASTTPTEAARTASNTQANISCAREAPRSGVKLYFRRKENGDLVAVKPPVKASDNPQIL